MPTKRAPNGRLLVTWSWIAFVLGMLGCGGSTGMGPDSPADAARAAAIDMELRTADDTLLSLRELRGQPLLLYLFATFDLGSQHALVPLQRLMERHPSLQVLGIAVQPDPGPILPLFAEGLEVPFPLAYDPESQVVAGESPLGEIPAIPAFVLLDARGQVRGHYVGLPTDEELERLLTLL